MILFLKALDSKESTPLELPHFSPKMLRQVRIQGCLSQGLTLRWEKQDMLTLSSCNSQTLMADMMVFPQAMTSSLTAFLNYGNTHLLENKGCGELQLRCGIMLAQQTGSPMILRSTL